MWDNIKKIRVFIADDHPLIRDGLKAIIGREADMEVVGEAADGESAWRQAERLQPDVAIMDISMPLVSGVQATERLRECAPDVKVLALTVYDDKGHLRQLMAAGARGYVLKGSSSSELLRAVRAIAEGGMHIDSQLESMVLSGFVRRPERSPHEVDLSSRETEVVRLVARGFTNREITQQLGVSIKTVETYKARSMEKLGIKTRADIVSYAARQGWLQEA
jgi:DNA-binding NarL/FixJ family response regulator